MYENLAGIIKLAGISIILMALWVMMIQMAPDSFLDAGNIENLLRRTALFSILGIGVAFVIMTGGIDLSLGSLVCLSGCFLALFLKVDYQPYQQGRVYEIRQQDSTMLVDPGSMPVVPGRWQPESAGQDSGNEETGDDGAGEGDLGDEGRELAAARDLADAGRWAPGQWIRMYQTKLNRSGMFRVMEVRFEPGAGQVLLTVSPAPARDEVSRDGGPIARITPALPVLGYAADQEALRMPVAAEGVPPLVPRDRLWLADPSGRLKELVIRQTVDWGGQRGVKLDGDPGLGESQWYWVALQRRQKMSVPLALAAVLGIGLGLGALHGVLVTALRLQPFVVTLCGLLIYRGWARWLSDDQSVGFGSEYADSLSWFALGRVPIDVPGTTENWDLNVPYAFLVLVVVAIVAMIFLNHTIWGRYILALGRNEEAARFSGIATGRMKLLAYTISGFLASVCGILFAIDSGSISPSNAGSYFELYAIAAAVLGGCSLRGGEGSIIGVIVGTALMQTLNNMITMLKIPNTIELVVLGGVILMGVIADELVRRGFGLWGARQKAK